jgi:hypothetical protein
VRNRNDLFVVARRVRFRDFFDPVGFSAGRVLLLRAKESAASHVHVNDTFFGSALDVFLEFEAFHHEVPEVHHFLVLAAAAGRFFLRRPARARAAFPLFFALLGLGRRLVGVCRHRLVGRRLWPRVLW